MRKIIYGMMMSLDGYIESVNHDLNWVIIDEELHSFVNERERNAGAYLYGRRIYEVMASYWPTADQLPDTNPFEVEYAKIWQSKPKYIFSRTLETVEASSRLVREDAVSAVRALKAEPGGNLLVGGAEFAASLEAQGLIDEYEFYIHPVVIGGGTPAFSGLAKPIPMTLLETRRFSSGVVLLHYAKAREGKV